MVKISVIIPTYNRAKMVAEAVASVLTQTEADLEVIVVDDGSADDTRNVIESINDERLFYFYKENGGPANARNFGLSEAQGEYIAFLDSDDYWPRDYLEKMLTALLENPDYGLAYASIALVDEDGQINKIRNPAEFCKSGWVTRDLFRKGFVSPVAVLIKSELLRGFYFDEFLLTAEDSDFFLRLSLKTRFLYVHNVTVSTRMSKNSICHETGLNYNRILSLERFYCRIDECKSIPSWIVRRKLGHQYRRVAKEHQKLKHKKAALYLYQKAIGYWPLDLRLYFGMLQVVLLDKNKDSDPAWRMPAFLSEPFRTNRFQSVG